MQISPNDRRCTRNCDYLQTEFNSFFFPLVAQTILHVDWKTALGRVALIAFGVLIPWLLWLLYFWTQDGLLEFLSAMIDSSKRYAWCSGLGCLRPIIPRVIHSQLYNELPWRGRLSTFFVFPVIVVILGANRNYRVPLLGCVWFAASLVAIASIPRLYGHYTVFIIPGFVYLAYATGTLLQENLLDRDRITPMKIFAGGCLAVLAFCPTYSQLLSGRIEKNGDGFAYQQACALGKAVKIRKNPGDKLLIFGVSFFDYVCADLPPASRIFYGDAPVSAAERDISLKTALDAQPKFLILSRNFVQEPTNEDSVENNISKFMLRTGYLHNYTQIEDNQFGAVWERNDVTAPK